MNADTPADDRVEFLFHEVLQQPREMQQAFLDHECGSDAELRAEVEDLLRAHYQDDAFLRAGAPRSLEFEAELAHLRPEEAGQRIGGYRLLQQIGEGGFGVVWMAEQERPVRRRVALKIIKLGMDTKEVVARFEQERQALALMEHPNIAKVFDAGATEWGRPFFVMELVKGIKITDYCDQENMTIAERLKLFVQVCNAIQHAHQKGIIHRDLKPSNVLVTLHDGVPVPKVIDFGVAKAIQQQRLTDLTLFTRFEQMVGTPLYMAPEQAEQSGLDIDTRSDIYSLGVLLYELLTGRTPFDPAALMNAGFNEMRRVIREVEPQKPSTFVSTIALELRTNVAKHRSAEGAKLINSIKGDLDWIVMKALEKDRDRRYETASSFARDVERHLGSEPVQARPPSATYRIRRFVRRNQVTVAAGAAIVATLIVGFGVSAWQALRAQREAQRATSALTELRATAPAFAEQARNLAAREQFDDALEKLDAAIRLRPDVSAYALLKADLLQSQFRFAEATEVYREVLRLQPDSKRALSNAALCERLAGEMTVQQKLTRESLVQLYSTMQTEQRTAAEMMKVGKLLGTENSLLRSYWLERLKVLPITPDRPLEERLTVSDSNLLSLDLSTSGLADLTLLQGVPLGRLILAGCPKITNLDPLRGMPLQTLLIGTSQDEHFRQGLESCEVSDLAPLRGMPLRCLDFESNQVHDLSPLRGMPLETLRICKNPVADLAPLGGLPLKYLFCGDIPAVDYSPLRGAPLEVLELSYSRVGNISFLQGMPLKHLLLAGCERVRGYKVLRGLGRLEVLHLPPNLAHLEADELKAIEMLRDHPSLLLINHNEEVPGGSNSNVQPASVFWKHFDEEMRARKGLLQFAGNAAYFHKRTNGTWAIRISNKPISDLTPLTGIAVSQLSVQGTDIADLTPLKGMPLESLYLSNTKVSDVSALKGLPLKVLMLNNCAPGIDLSPLAGVETLEMLLLPPKPKNLDALQKLPKLRRLSYEFDAEASSVTQSAADFWSGKQPISAGRYAMEGKLAEAENLLREEVRRQASADNWEALGAVIFASGDRTRYEAHCAEMIERFGRTDFPNAATTLRVCLLGREPAISAKDLDDLMKRAGPLEYAPNPAFFLLTRGLFEYRRGNYSKAVGSMNGSWRGAYPAISAAAAAVGAMAYYRDGNREMARIVLARARSAVAENWPTNVVPAGDWIHWFIAQMLLNEAETVVPGERDPKK